MLVITRLEEKREHKGGKTAKLILPRYQMISSHTARRTGATLLYLQGIPKKQIMLLTGHKKDEHFDRYIRIGSYANAKMLADHDFFRKKESLRIDEAGYVNGFYWVHKRGKETVCELKDGVVYSFLDASVLLAAFLKQGWKIISKIDKP